MAASDPLIWEQHPIPDRYKPDVFRSTFFDSAIANGNAFIVLDAQTGDVIGSSRYYDHEPELHRVGLGYTFLVRSRWGGIYNTALKQLMIDHAFTFADTVVFHVWEHNMRSQMAVLKLGAKRVGLQPASGDPGKMNYLFELHRGDWRKNA